MTQQSLKAIILHRPWPYAIAHLGKDIENRTWRCPLEPGTLIAIHAGKQWDESGAEFIRRFYPELPPEPDHPTGIVAIARFIQNVSTSKSSWFSGPWGWVLEDVKALSPIPYRGQQGLWTVNRETTTLIQALVNQPGGDRHG